MKVSIIVCTFNRAGELGKCLDSIAASLTAAAPVEGEIVVVDNASTDNTSAVIKKWAESCSFPVKLLYEPKQGLSAARNCALRAAQGDLLVFTDDDCRLNRDYVADALRHNAADTEPVLRGGRVELGDPADLPLTILTGSHVKRWSKQMNSARHENVGYSIFGCNMTLPRILAERIGFFDEDLGAGGGIPASEDIDYVFRCYLAGVTTEYVPDMKVFHYHGRKTKDQGEKLLQNYAIGEGALYAKYFFKEPNFCRMFVWNLKDALREIFSGKNLYRMQNADSFRDLDFSYKNKIFYNLRGALKYILVRTGG